MNNNIIPLDLWGGEQTFTVATSTYKINRSYGLFSNITVSLFGICKIKTLGYDVKNINLFLNEYTSDYDFYNDLFIKKEDMTEELITADEANDFINQVHPTNMGLSRGWGSFRISDLNNVLPTISKIYNYFYTVNRDVLHKIKKLEEVVKEQSTSAFVWARKTDKTGENSVPSAEKYLQEINKHTDIKNIYVQTDDPTVIEEFTKISDDRIVILNMLPISTNQSGFHYQLRDVSNDEFYEKYNTTKIEYLQNMLAMTYTAANCKLYVGYPGNLTSILPIIKNSFDGCILFLNSEQLVDI
jgi:hypothetical protein